jgi:hypothetical protein
MEPLLIFFRNESSDNPRAKNIYTELSLPETRLYLKILSYITAKINEINLIFQSEKPEIYRMLPTMKRMFRNILHNFLTNNYVDSLEDYNQVKIEFCNMKELDEIYLGSSVEEYVDKNAFCDEVLDLFYTNCQYFYIELAKQIKNASTSLIHCCKTLIN